MAKLTEYAKCAVCQFCHYWWFSFLGPTARIGGYSRIFHWPPYVGGPMRTILPILFNCEIFFFIVSGDLDRIFANCSRVILGFFLICSRTASIVVWVLVWVLVWVSLYEGLLKHTVTNPFPFVYVGSSTSASRQLSAIP